jgi:MurNAc alpha-1-phosphate uridylyltransferase
MILAAGQGKRMGELTREIPKPLLKANGRYLIEYSLQALANVGITEVVINVCYHADKIQQALGDGRRYGVDIQYSVEEEVLETGGGIYQALPLLGAKPFLVLSCDVVSDYPLQNLPMDPAGLAHLVLVSNPHYHPQGDFCLQEQQIFYGKGQTFTFGNIGIYRPELFAHCQPGKFRLGELLKRHILNHKVTGEHYEGVWHNVGTPEDLALLSEVAVSSSN